MAIPTSEERLALLLCVLGEEAEAAAMKQLNPTRAVFISKLLNDYKQTPPNEDEVAYIVDDFSKYFSFAMSTLEPTLKQAGKNKRPGASSEVPGNSAGPQLLEFQSVEETGDYLEDLNQLDAFQIATALEQDHPKTIAFVVNQLSTSQAAAVVKQLDDDVRRDTVVYLSHGVAVRDAIARQIIKTTFQRANAVTVKKSDVSQADLLAQLMRSLPKEMRLELIEKLNEDNADIVQDIRSKLYVFEDVLRLDDRDTQKLIAETGSDHLVSAMQRVDPEIKAKLLDNLSKRARQSLEAEIEFKTNASDQEVEEARATFVETLGRLDEAGEISLA